MSEQFEIFQVQVGLKRKTASVALRIKPPGGQMLNANFHFDPPGSQTEEELEKLALERARQLFAEAADFLAS